MVQAITYIYMVAVEGWGGFYTNSGHAHHEREDRENTMGSSGSH